MINISYKNNNEKIKGVELKDFNWLDSLWCVVKEDGTFAGIPCRSAEEALDLSAQHYGSGIFKMQYDWNTDPFGLRFVNL